MLVEYGSSNRELLYKAVDMMPDTIKGRNLKKKKKKKSHFKMIHL